MDSQEEDFGLSGTWLLLYFGCMGLCSVLTACCMVFLHWRKKVRRERRAQQWAQVMKAASFPYCPHLYWINKRRRCGLNAAITIAPPEAATNPEFKVDIPDSTWGSDASEGDGYASRGRSPYTESPGLHQPALVVPERPLSIPTPQRRIRSPLPIPTFRERPVTPPLRNPAPRLHHSASYLLSCPQRNVHFCSLPTLDCGVNCSSEKPFAPDPQLPLTEGGSFRGED
ncbi:Testis-expressed sequence 38 protein [Sciurus carolinensis]|uniref:Testis-expressed sequence 38 protein n=1 Tax=Sciurus carolinensis TaxID=30640 RepID=A0AA41ST77_SCICA|nr:Testis-expressed sequence 38 protein [Sciurus carolinensis]MBZ3875413.1 Testis-expressed sequence 38 protein [Sciurus carolinensis]MBZ3881041.1 Testis-expressed sequence 38 protein [Sciurus carolinensis]